MLLKLIIFTQRLTTQLQIEFIDIFLRKTIQESSILSVLINNNKQFTQICLTMDYLLPSTPKNQNHGYIAAIFTSLTFISR
jgi:hypothetical protein